MRELVRGGTTLVFVTHNLDQMQSICRRAIVLERGRVEFEGSSRDAVGHYMTAMSRAYAKRPTDITDEETAERGAAELLTLRFLDAAGEEVVWVRPRERVRAELTFCLRRPIPKLVIEINMRAAVNENVLSFNSGRDGWLFPGTVGTHRVVLDIPAIPLSSGQYFWNVRMWDADRGTTELDTPLKFPMVIDDEGRATGVLALEHEWICEPRAAARADVTHETECQGCVSDRVGCSPGASASCSSGASGAP
jgi:hypothetical protein